jgi:hypothetical protein
MKSFQITYLSFTIWPNIIISYIYSSTTREQLRCIHVTESQGKVAIVRPLGSSALPTKRRRRLQNKRWRSNKPPFLLALPPPSL